LSGIYVHG